MKKYFTAIILSVFLSSFAYSAEVEIDLTAGYANDVWYDFSNGVVKSEPGNNWDLAVQTNTQDAGVWINSHNGCKAWVVPNSNGDTWGDVIDTTGMDQTWVQGYNSEESWAIGSLNLGMNGFETNGDFGWGEYNMATHSVSGNKVFVVKLVNKTYIRLMVESLFGGTFSLKWADLDGSNERLLDVKKSNYANKLFAYIQLADGTVIDREPALDSWALLFGKYIGMTATDTGELLPYGMTGVRTNPSYRTAEVKGVPTSASVAPFLDDENYSSAIATIGSDWKKLNFATFSYFMIDSLTYFVTKDLNGTDQPTVNKIVFKSFIGSSTGKLTFDLNGTTSVSEQQILADNLNIYPSIASKNTEINIELTSEIQGNVSITLMDITGRTISTKNIVNNAANSIEKLLIPAISSGQYIVVVQNNQATIAKTIIVN